GSDVRHGPRRGGGPRRRPHPRRRHDPEGDREERDETLDGVPPAHPDDEEGHRWDRPDRDRFAGGPRGPREVLGSTDGVVPILRVAPGSRGDDARPRGGGFRGSVPRARGTPAAAGRDLPRGRDPGTQDASDHGRRGATASPRDQDARLAPQDRILCARLRGRAVPRDPGHQPVGAPCRNSTRARTADPSTRRTLSIATHAARPSRGLPNRCPNRSRSLCPSRPLRRSRNLPRCRPNPGPKATEELAEQLAVAVALLRERRFEEAIEPLLKSIARDDENRTSWILLGEAYLRVDRPYKAAVAYLRSLELSPKDEQAWLGLGRVLRFIDELPTAAAVLERATRIRPEHADTWVERGLVLASMQKLPEALRSFGKALDIRPDHRIALAKRTEVEAMLREQGAVEADPEPAESDTLPRPPNAAEAEAAFEVDILEEIEDSIQEEARKTMQAVREGPRTVPPAPVPEAPRPPRVPTFVEGLDETMDGGIPWGHLVLIEGAPGTMKSSLAFSILLHNAAREGLHCLYVSLEERASSLLKQMG